MSSQTRLEIMNVARDLFHERGLGGTSMRDIARGAGLAQSSLYNHFATKDALVMAVMERSWEVVAHPVGEVFQSEAPGLGLLEKVMRAHALQHSQPIKETMVFEWEGRNMSAAVRQRTVELRDIYERRFQDLAQQLAMCGCISGVETGTRMKMLLSMGRATSGWFRPGGRLSAEEVAMLYGRMCLMSLEADEARCRDHSAAWPPK
jgi:TetR/AcrR family transcriptional regulator, cholesterol catabolism regulator